MIKRILKPSFRLKSAHTVEFSPCGKYLAQLQDSARITIWGIKERSIIANYKLIKSESYIGFSPDSSIMFCKNANGELVFFETLTGNVLSETGSFNLSRLGGEASLVSNKELFDGDSNGNLFLWNTADATVKCCIEYENHMIRGVRKLGENSYLALVYPKYNEKSSGCMLMKFNEPVNLNDFELIKPHDSKYQWLGNWKRIRKFSTSNESNEIIVLIEKADQNTPEILVKQDLQSNYSYSYELEKSNEYTWSLSSNNTYFFVVIHTNFYQQGMSSSKYQELKNNNESEHIHIFEKEGLKRVAKIHWPDVSRVSCHPNNKSIAIAADQNSVYLDDYSVLFS